MEENNTYTRMMDDLVGFGVFCANQGVMIDGELEHNIGDLYAEYYRREVSRKAIEDLPEDDYDADYMP